VQDLLLSYASETAIPAYSQTLDFDLAAVMPCVAGPKRPQGKVPLSELKSDFHACLSAPLGFKGFAAVDPQRTVPFTYQGRDYVLTHGSVVLASITACTNTANSNVMLAAGLLARKARLAGLQTADYIKTSLSPGSHVTETYLKATGLL
jgi:aconitate hydratase